MNAQILISQVEARAKDAGVPIAAICREAGVNVSNWRRWRSGETTPTLRKWEQIERATAVLLPSEAVE